MLLLLLADGAPVVTGGVDVSTIMPSLSALGSLGFAIWFAYYTVTSTLPALQKEHRDEREKAIAVFAETQRQMLDELRAARESYNQWRQKP